MSADATAPTPTFARGLESTFVKFYAVSSLLQAEEGVVVNGSTNVNPTGTETDLVVSGSEPGSELGLGLGLGPGLDSEETLSALSPDMAFYQEGIVLLRAVFDPTDESWRGLDHYDEKGLVSCRNYLPSVEQVHNTAQ